VLVAEDEAGVRRLLRRMLEAAGYEVLLAAHGLEALGLVQDHAGDIDFLVTDLEMPHMGGKELAEQAVAHRPGLRILFLSGYSEDHVRSQSLPVRGARFLQKPFSDSEVMRALEGLRDERA